MKRCNYCGCVAFDDEANCIRCGSSSFAAMRDDEATLHDGICYAAAIDRDAPYDMRRCEPLLSDIVPHLEKEQHVLDTAFRVGAIEALRYATQGDQNYQIAIERMERDGMLNSTGIAIVLEGYGFTPPSESLPPDPPMPPDPPTPVYPPYPNPPRQDTAELTVAPEDTNNGGNNRLAIGLLVAEVILIAVLVTALIPRMMSGSNKSTPTDQLAESTESVSKAETSSDEESGSKEDSSSATESTDEPEPAPQPIPTPKSDEENNASSGETKVPPSEHRYEVVRADISWTDAKAACEAKGGHLATITSDEEFDTIVSQVKQNGLEFAWLGGQTASGSTEHDGEWITGEPFTFSRWYPGEPSHRDTDGTPEQYIELWHVKANDEWSMNDERDRPFENPASAQYMSGNMGYVCEYEA